MLNQIKTITLGVGYGLYLTFLAPAEQRQAALARVRNTPQSEPKAQPQPEETIPDPWTLPVSEAPSPAPQQPQAIAPMLLLPAANELSAAIDYRNWTITELKNEAKRRKVKGYNRFTSKTRHLLIEQLTA